MSAQARIDPALAEQLRGAGLSDEHRFELAFHLSELLADLAPMAGLITDGKAPTREEVHEFVSAVAFHWPYHVKHAAELEGKMKEEPE